MEFKRVVVTGLGALTPLGNSVPEFWDNLRKGVSGGGPLTYFDTSKFKTRIACQLKNLDVHKFLEKKEARKLDPYSQYALIAADEAVVDSKLDLTKEDKTRIGVIWATGVGGIDSYAKAMMEYCAGDGTPRFSLLVRDGDIKLFLELHDQLNRVERIGTKIIGKGCFRRNLAFINA